MLRIGVVGTGSITERFIQAVKADGHTVVTSVCSRALDRATAFAQSHQIPLTFSDVAAMCDSNQIDAVYIATPNSTHYAVALVCIQHNKHVMCEKPLASSAKEAKAIIDAARAKKVLLMEALRIVANPAFIRVKEALPKIGKVRKAYLSFCQISSKIDQVRQGKMFSSFSPEFSGGSLMDLGIYCVHCLLSLFGEPSKIFSFGTLLPTGIDGEASIICTYPEMTAIISCSKISNGVSRSEIQGENGTISIDKLGSIGECKITFKDGSEEILNALPTENDLSFEIGEFRRTVESEKLESDVITHFASAKAAMILDEARKQIGIKIQSSI